MSIVSRNQSERIGMKCRHGFVSNSSSSSYVIILGKSDFDKLKEEVTLLQRDMLAYVSNKGKTKTFLGSEVVSIEYEEGDCSSFDYYRVGDGGVMENERKKYNMARAEAEEKLLKENPDAGYSDLHKVMAKVEREFENDHDFSKEWSTVVEKIKKLPEDRVFMSGHEF